jgi:hypothetical protein
MTRAIVPLPIQLVIDDMGWRSGEDGSARGEPYRTDARRNHGVEDYAAIVRIGRALGVRPQAAMVLCEWDRTDCLRRVPSATWMGSEWRNPFNHGSWMEECGDLLRREREHVEITLHGVGHEFWYAPGRFTRAEWHDAQATVRPRGELVAHLDAYAELLDQHGLGGFPASFVPTAGFHRVGSGLAELLSARGLRLMSTPFVNTAGSATQRWPWFDVDAGVLLVERGPDPFGWNRFSGRPTGDIDQPIVGTHWPNLLHPDPTRSDEVADGWIDWLRAQGRRPGRMLARDSAHLHDQLAYHACLRLAPRDGGVVIDASALAGLPLRVGTRCTIDVVGDLERAISASDAKIIASAAWRAGAETVQRLDLELSGPEPRLSWRGADAWAAGRTAR